MSAVEINVTPFKFKHLESLISLLKSQNYPDIHNIQMRTLPKVGYIAFCGKEPIACGFLRRLEPCFAQIDTLVSNGFMGSVIRHEGIKIVVENLIEDAKRLKLEGIIAHTMDNGTLKRAESIGFKVVPQTIIALSLQEPSA